jgi:hypothetical protein
MASLLDTLKATAEGVVADARKKAIKDAVLAIVIAYVLIEATKEL